MSWKIRWSVIRSSGSGRRGAARSAPGARRPSGRPSARRSRWSGRDGRPGRRPSRSPRAGGTRASSRAGPWSRRRRELLGRQQRLALARLAQQLGHLVELERAEVDAVDRGHGRDVAGAEALEVAHVEVRVALGLLAEALVQRVGAVERARDVRAHEDPVAADGLGVEHVVEGRHRAEVAGGQAHHARDLLDRLGRAPAVMALRGGQRRDRRRAAVGVLRHVRLDLGAQVVGHGRRRGVRHRGRVLVQVDRPVPAGHAGAVLEARNLAWPSSGRCLRAPGRASRASRSGRRCTRP